MCINWLGYDILSYIFLNKMKAPERANTCLKATITYYTSDHDKL